MVLLGQWPDKELWEGISLFCYGTFKRAVRVSAPEMLASTEPDHGTGRRQCASWRRPRSSAPNLRFGPSLTSCS